MAEIEVHTGHHGGEDDPAGKVVGFQVGVIGILLAVTTIAAHRQHTDAVIYRTEANDQWSYYQAKKVREHVSGVGQHVIELIAPEKAQLAKEAFAEERKHYAEGAEESKQHAEAEEARTARAEVFALRFDLGEGLLELGLVLSSLYFLGRRKLFYLAGRSFALLGLVTALSVLLV
jgi:hypothetical protein